MQIEPKGNSGKSRRISEHTLSFARTTGQESVIETYGAEEMSITYTDNSREAADALDKAILRGLEIIGGQAETYAKQLCPVDTGRLRNSITHMVEKEEHAAVIGTNVEYAPFAELGTVKQKPQPYLRPAIENHISEYQNILENEVKRG